MTSPARDTALDPLPSPPGEYGLIAAGSLILVVLGLVQARMGPWSVLPAVVGGVALLLRWRSAPLLILPAVVLVVLARAQGLDPYQMLVRLVAVAVGWVVGVWFGSPLGTLAIPTRPPSLFAEAFLAAGMLGYFTAAYRLGAARFGLFPPEPRRTASRPLPRPRDPQPPPPAFPVPGRAEAMLQGAFLLAVALVGLLAWRWVDRHEPPLDLQPSAGRLVLVIGLLGIPAVVASGLLRAAATRTMTRAQAALFLQDVAWRETRREQRRIQRWRVWARLRRDSGGRTP